MTRWALILFATACGTPTATLVDAGSADEPDAALDLARARWVHNPVYSDSATSVSSSDLTISPDGELISAWAEDVGDQLIRTEIFIADRGPEDFTTRSVFAIPDISFTQPSVFAGEGAMHAAASANVGAATRNDIFYSRRESGAWSAQINLTGPADALGLVQHDPVVLESGSETVVLFRVSTSTMGTIEPTGVHMLRFTNPLSPGPSIPILDRTVFDCNDIEGVVDASGSVHFIATCSENDEDRAVYYVTNKSGAFINVKLTTPNATFPLSPDIALSEGGDVVHLLWNASTDCGGITCRDVFYSRDLGTPVSVSGGEEDGGFFPHVAVDKQGRVIIVFHRLGNVDDVMWTYSEVGNAFARIQLATPGTPESIDSTVGNLVMNPLTDRPHMVYSHSILGPAGSNVFHGELVR